MRGSTEKLTRKVALGEYEIDVEAVAEAILARTAGGAELPFASGVLVASEGRGHLAIRREQCQSQTRHYFS